MITIAIYFVTTHAGPNCLRSLVGWALAQPTIQMQKLDLNQG